MSLKKHLERVSTALDTLEALELDLLSLCAELADLHTDVIDLRKRAKQGIATEKMSPTGEVLSLIETHPSIEAACNRELLAIVKFKHDLVKDLVKTVQLEEPPETNITLNIIPVVSEPTP